LQEAVPSLPGVGDLDPAAFAQLDAAQRSLLRTFALAGFEQVDVPVLEHLELYLRKNGAQVLPRVYTFQDPAKQEVALRPEYTASVIRAFARRVDPTGAPLRVAYAGPVFRYDDPAPSVARQFTQAGVEVLGDAGIRTDAAVIALACEAAQAAGAGPLVLVLGHLGLVRAVLAQLDVGSYAEQYLLEHLELFNQDKAPIQLLRQRLGLYGVEPAPTSEDDERLAAALARAVRDAAPEEARDLVAAIVDQMGVSLLGSTRSPEDILDRMLQKAQRRAAMLDGQWQRSLDRALQFLARLCTLRGPAGEVMRATTRLLAEYGLPDVALADLREVLGYLADHDLPDVLLEVAPGMARGIAYYSGTIFELYAVTAAGERVEIGGGGRYDALAQALAATTCPALGFALNVQRLVATLSRSAQHRSAIVVLWPEPAVPARRVLTLLRHLREAGFVAVTEAPPHQSEEALQAARNPVALVRLDASTGESRLRWLHAQPAPEQRRTIESILAQGAEGEQGGERRSE
jgi:histidyl-tRNA synthetase